MVIFQDGLTATWEASYWHHLPAEGEFHYISRLHFKCEKMSMASLTKQIMIASFCKWNPKEVVICAPAPELRQYHGTGILELLFSFDSNWSHKICMVAIVAVGTYTNEWSKPVTSWLPLVVNSWGLVWQAHPGCRDTKGCMLLLSGSRYLFTSACNINIFNACRTFCLLCNSNKHI